MKRVIPAWLLSSFLFFSGLFSQQRIAFNHLTVEDGLSQSSVTCIFQDQKGFMWFGTQDGLNRYDGYDFKIFKNDPSDSTSLTDNFIFSIYENPSGTLYIETQGGALHQYIARNESFMIINKDSIDLNNLKVSTVGAFLQESTGIKWTGGLGSGTGLQRTDTKSGQITIFKHNSNDPFSLSDDKVYSVFRDRSGNLWIGTYNGLDRFDEKNGKFIHYRNNPNDPNSLPDNWVWPIYQDTQGYLWIGTVRGGLSRFDPKSDHFVNYKNDPLDPTSINNNFVFSIYEDRSSVIWIGTNLGGINNFRPAANVFEHYQKNPGDDNSLSDNLVASILVDKNGIYWIGTSNGGLNKFDNKNKRFTNYKHDPKNRNSLISNSVQSLLEDNSGKIWIGSFSDGLDAFDPQAGTFTHYTHNPTKPGSISDNRIYALSKDQYGNIWIGTYAGGVNKIEEKTGNITHYRHSKDDSLTISSDAAWSLAHDDSGHLWIGTFGGGVSVLNPQTQTFRRFRNNPEDSTSIIDNNIIRVIKDNKGNMWFGTTKGLCRYLRESDSFTSFDENDGLANNFVYGIVEDENGNLWLSTNNGLSQFNPENVTFKNYYDKDGLQGNEFNQNAYAKDANTGNLLFGGPNGFNIFNPDNIKDNKYRPPVEFTAYIRYNTDHGEGKPIIEKGISDRDQIVLTYKDNIVSFGFSALNYYNTQDNQYKYQLQGFNNDWIQLGHSHSVTFTNLSAGEYTLRVIGSNNDGLWNDDGRSLKILVTPPWWKTRLAYFLYFLAFFSIMFGVRRYEINRREQKSQLRESALQIKATEAEKRALEIENERKSIELEEARQLQLSMLPKELPDLADLEIAVFMRTATEVGGDYYDIIIQEDGVLNVAFGDATGHGLQAGTMVTLMKGFFTSDSSKLGLIDFMSHCNKVIKEIKLGRIVMSFSYLKIYNKVFQVTSAGMPPIFLHHKKNNQLEEILIEGMPLGAMKNAQYKTVERELDSGDTILLLTDGLPELMNDKDEMFDYDRVKEYLIEFIEDSPDTIITKLVAEGDSWRGGRSQDDDVSFVVIRVK